MSTELQVESRLALKSAFFDQKITVISGKEQKKLAFLDIINGITKFRIWLMLAYQDIKLRYRRSVLGPFWLTLSMAITVYSMGFLYSRLFNTDLQTYFPYLVTGMLAWTLISTLLCEQLETFTNCEGLIKQIKLPYSLYVHRVTSRNMMIFLHNILVYIPIIIIFHETAKINFYFLLIFPGLMIIAFNATVYGLILAMIGARYRDLVQIVKSLIQVAFFITPVMWNPNVLTVKYQHIVHLNPFYSFIELIRGPLMGYSPSANVFLMVLLITLIGICVSSWMFTKYRSRIVYWL